MAAISLSGGGSGSGGLQPESVSGGDNSLTQYERSVSNLIGTSGAQAQQIGADALSKPLDYWSKILSGNKAEIGAALQPEIGASNDQFQAQKKVLDQYTPMGGGRSSAMANLATKKAQTNANIISTARSGAATSLAETGLAEQQLGVQQLGQAIQAILSKMGLDIQGGTSQTFSQIVSAIGSLV